MSASRLKTSYRDEKRELNKESDHVLCCIVFLAQLNNSSIPGVEIVGPTQLRKSQSLWLEARVQTYHITYYKLYFSWYKYNSTNSSRTRVSSPRLTKWLEIPKGTLSYGINVIELEMNEECYSGVTDQARTHALVQVTKSPLVAIISGGSEVLKNHDSAVAIDASSSYDPDEDSKSKFENIFFTWFCRKGVNGTYNQSCFVGKSERLNNTGSKIELFKTTPESNATYRVTVEVSKGNRYGNATQIMHVVDWPITNIIIR